jgi:hypothetical protein
MADPIERYHVRHYREAHLRVLARVLTASPNPQTLRIASYGANRLGLEVGKCVHIHLSQADQEYVGVLAADPVNQTLTVVFRKNHTKSHAAGATVHPTIWPTPVLNEGDHLAFDIRAVASPDPGSDLTVVIQT